MTKAPIIGDRAAYRQSRTRCARQRPRLRTTEGSIVGRHGLTNAAKSGNLKLIGCRRSGCRLRSVTRSGRWPQETERRVDCAANACAAVSPTNPPAAPCVFSAPGAPPMALWPTAFSCQFRTDHPPLLELQPAVTHTARVPARESVFEILYRTIAGGLVHCLNVSEPRRRLARCPALYDLRHWCVRHATRTVAALRRGGIREAFRRPRSGGPFARQRRDRSRTRLARARVGVYGGARFRHGPAGLTCRAGTPAPHRLPLRLARSLARTRRSVRFCTVPVWLRRSRQPRRRTGTLPPALTSRAILRPHA